MALNPPPTLCNVQDVLPAVYSLDTGAVDFLNVREQLAKLIHTEEDLDQYLMYVDQGISAVIGEEEDDAIAEHHDEGS